MAKRKRVRTQIRTDIPEHRDAVVTRVEVTRTAKQRILTKSEKVAVPVTESAPLQYSPSDSAPSAFSEDPGLTATKERRGPSRSVTTKLDQWWQEYEGECADRIIEREGLGNNPTRPICKACGGDALYRCEECFSPRLRCKDCIVRAHMDHPLHRIEFWNGNFFTEKTLFDLGASYQLGHDIEEPCSQPSEPVKLMLFDISGVQTVRFTYCNCTEDGVRRSGSRRSQLLLVKWFPASWSRPGTAFTFRLLDFLHKLQTRSKVNLYDFYAAVLSITNLAGLSPPIHRYNELTLVLRIWVYLRLVRRGGGVHASDRSAALTPGSLAVECPACPHPGKNLVSPQPDSWLNTLYLSMDANFKLKQKERGFSDPPLSNGLAFMVPNKGLQEHLSYCTEKKLTTEINTCGSNFNAISQAYSKFSKAYSVTGVGGVDCARHGFKRPNGVVDLQKGERYCNMDYALLSTLVPSLNAGISRVLVSYDIGCQWHKNLQARIRNYPSFSSLDLSKLKYWRVLVPKFHLPGHGTDCHVVYNLSFAKWAGRMDGERIEGGWAESTNMATWTRECGPNARRNILDDHWNASNWRKFVGLRTSLEKNLRRSVAWSKSQREVAILMSGGYSDATVQQWREMKEEFDLDQTKPNPYEEVENHTTMAQLRLELLKEEARERSARDPLHKVSGGGFFRKAIEVEDRQYALDVKEKARTSTAQHHAELLELRNTLSRNLRELRQSQRIYMPGLNPVLEDDEYPTESTKLLLPSELSQEDRAAWCLPGIPELEFRFRYAQADDSLAEVRRLRRLLQGLRDQDAKHPSLVQRSRTRTNGVFATFDARIRRAAGRYRRSRRAMLALDPSQKLSPGWASRFRELRDADIRGPGREKDDKSEGRFQMSWIWLVPRLTKSVLDGRSPPSGPIAASDATRCSASSTTDPISEAEDDEEVAESMRVYWVKCQARAERYEEEVKLTVEEMGRTLRYFEWKKTWWLSLQSAREQSTSPPPLAVRRGLRAYAHRQAHVYATLITSFVGRWRAVLLRHGLSPRWLSRYPVAPDPLAIRPSRGHSQPRAKPKTPSLAATRGPQKPVVPPSPSSATPVDPHMETDPPLETDTEDDADDAEYVIDEGELDLDD